MSRAQPPDVPTPQTLSQWCCARLGVPSGTFISRHLWREATSRQAKWHRAFQTNFEGASFLELVRQNVSALALAEMLATGWTEETNGARRYPHPFKWSPLSWAELELRGDIEVLGRVSVFRRGREHYARRLDELCASDKKTFLTQHERLETLLRWNDESLFAPRDEAFCARFLQILEEHAKWQRGEGGTRAVLCGRDLREVSWPRGALRGADLRGASLRNLNLDGEDLSGCDLRRADLVATRFVGAALQNADLRHARLELALFKDADLTGAQKDAHSTRARTLVDWEGHGVTGEVGIKMGWDLDWAELDLRGRSFARFSGGLHGDPSFRNSNLEGASFRGAEMLDADFRGANLRGADLSRLDCAFGKTRFDGADLTGANVWGAWFRDANFDGAILDDLQNKDSAQWDENPPRNPDFRGADFSDARFYDRNFSGCNLEGANFRGADLRGANFANANLSGADLRGAGFKGASFVNANLSGARYSRLKMRGAKG